jgi:hypothetical protein
MEWSRGDSYWSLGLAIRRSSVGFPTDGSIASAGESLQSVAPGCPGEAAGWLLYSALDRPPS